MLSRISWLWVATSSANRLTLPTACSSASAISLNETDISVMAALSSLGSIRTERSPSAHRRITSLYSSAVRSTCRYSSSASARAARSSASADPTPATALAVRPTQSIRFVSKVTSSPSAHRSARAASASSDRRVLAAIAVPTSAVTPAPPAVPTTTGRPNRPDAYTPAASNTPTPIRTRKRFSG